MSIVVNADGNVTVRSPLLLSKSKIERILADKAEWIEKQQGVIRSNSVSKHKFTEGESFYFLGKSYPLIFIKSQKPALIIEDALKLDWDSRNQAEELIIVWYQKQARKILSERLKQLAEIHNFKNYKFRLSGARTRWGSCSSKRNISISWRLVMAPPGIIDYVLIHELVHLEVHNHSKEFWRLLESIMPEYQKHRMWLKKNSTNLHV